MKMTRKEALEKELKKWQWIANEVKKQNKFIPEADYFEHIGEPDGGKTCYICQYAKQNKITCEECKRGGVCLDYHDYGDWDDIDHAIMEARYNASTVKDEIKKYNGSNMSIRDFMKITAHRAELLENGIYAAGVVTSTFAVTSSAFSGEYTAEKGREVFDMLEEAQEHAMEAVRILNRIVEELGKEVGE